MLYKFFKALFNIILVCFFILLFYGSFKDNLFRLYDKYFPCRKTIEYSISSFDKRFGISEEKFLKSIKKAEEIWEKSTGKNLFEYTAEEYLGDVLKINLIYDYRQETTSKLKALDLEVSRTRASYDTVLAKYQTLKNDYLENKRDFELQVSVFKNRQDQYLKDVNFWNKKGGAPQNVYDELSLEARLLKEEFERIKKIEGEINSQASDINTLVAVINDLAHALNINAEKLNNIGQVRGEEFTQGEYRTGSLGEEINIYEFSTEEVLTRLLTHELGHALGLGHVLDPNAIMYRLNENKNSELTEDDLNAFREHCRI